jgi:hypothetical protein
MTTATQQRPGIGSPIRNEADTITSAVHRTLERLVREDQFRMQTPGRAGYAAGRPRPPDEEADDDHGQR